MERYLLLIFLKFVFISINAQHIKTITIKKNEWIAENLTTTKFRNGDLIIQAKTEKEWNDAIKKKKPVWSYYENQSANNRFGKIYNWYAVIDPRGLAPKGYHIPTMQEWRDMINFLGEYEKNKIGSYEKVSFKNSRAAIKLFSKNDTIQSFTKYQGESEFNSKLGGCRNCGWPYEGINSFSSKNKWTGWWTSTDQNWESKNGFLDGNEIEIRSMTHTDSVYVYILRKDSLSITKERLSKVAGFYVRCIKDLNNLHKPNKIDTPIKSNKNNLIKDEKLVNNRFCFVDKYNSGNTFEVILIDGGEAKLFVKDKNGVVIRNGNGSWKGYNDGPGGDIPKIILKLGTGTIVFSAILDPYSSKIEMLFDSKGMQWDKCL